MQYFDLRYGNSAFQNNGFIIIWNCEERSAWCRGCAWPGNPKFLVEISHYHNLTLLMSVLYQVMSFWLNKTDVFEKFVCNSQYQPCCWLYALKIVTKSGCLFTFDIICLVIKLRILNRSLTSIVNVSI